MRLGSAGGTQSPATVLFLYSDTGGGHRAAAQAIDAALRRVAGDRIETHHVDAFATCGLFPLREGVASYGSMLKVQPSPYPALYHLTNGRKRFRVISELGLPFIRRDFERMIGAGRPQLVVSVHPLLNTFARHAIEEQRAGAALVTVITDLVSIHHSWTAGAAADEYVVATSEARDVCIERGIAAERVHDLGLPIRAGFGPPSPDSGAKRALGLDPSRRALLVMAGGEGGGRVGRVLHETARTIAALDIQVVVIAGRNESLKRRLEESSAELGRDARVLGFTDDIARYMRASDALLTKAGPGALAEAAACGVPVIVYEYISGQEKGNLEFVASRGMGVVAMDGSLVNQALERLFGGDGSELARMRSAALACARPNAAVDIARFLVSVLAARGANAPAWSATL